MRIIHHPKHFKSSRGKKPTRVDISVEQEKHLPNGLRESRQRDMNVLFEKITKDSGNFSFENSAVMKEYFFGGDAYSVVVFDCDTPSYMIPNDDGDVSSMQIVKIPNPEMK